MTPTLLFIAMLLDAVFGEPRQIWDRYPHPAVLIGRLIGWADDRFNTGELRRLKGVALVLALLAGSVLIAKLVEILPLTPVLEILIVAILLAQRSLVQHLRDVALALSATLSEGRRAVARIVGRDTAQMDDAGVARAAIESGAENLSDGVVAPVAFYLVFGLPGILAYKAINTADSMIGYKTPRHSEFGWAAAKLDDVLNWVPARLTAIIIATLSGSIGNWPDIIADAKKHRSPNAGWPEAAMARAVDVALAGPRSYQGQMTDFPFVNANGNHNPGPPEIRSTVGWLWRTWATCLVIVLACALLA